MRFSVLESSSSGNVIYLEHKDKKYLLDCGKGIRTIERRLKDIGIYLNKLDGIFISHEHSDHISGLSSVTNKYKTRIYMSKKSYNNMDFNEKEKISPILFTFIKKNEEYIIDGLKINTFPLNHDAAETIGFKISDEDERSIVYITDTGYLEKMDMLTNANAYIIESNHEPELLLNSSRPWELKSRIMSNLGHLSNEDSVKIFYSLQGDDTRVCVLYHLSSECNTKELAHMAYTSYLEKENFDLSKIKIIAANRLKATSLIEVE